MDFSYHRSYLYLLQVCQPNIDLVDDNPISSAVQVHVQLRRKTIHLLMNRSPDGRPSIVRQFKDPVSGSLDFRFDLRLLMWYNAAYAILSEQLSELQIDLCYHCGIIEKVIRCGLKIGNRVSNVGRKILPLRADILVVKKYVRDEWYLINRALRESIAENESRGKGMVPASETSIKALKRVRMEGGDWGEEGREAKRKCVRESESCVICLEQLPVGSYATRMPCSHAFHGGCIVKWLQESHFCPICRFKMPTTTTT